MKNLLIIFIIALIPLTFSSCFYLELEFEELEEITDSGDSGNSEPDDDSGDDDTPIAFPSDLSIVNQDLGTDNSYLLLFFSGPVYANIDGTGDLGASDLKLNFYSNGGEISSALISSTFHVAGSDMVQVYLAYDDEADGVEEIEILPADGSSIYDGEGKAVSATFSTGRIRLNCIDD